MSSHPILMRHVGRYCAVAIPMVAWCCTMSIGLCSESRVPNNQDMQLIARVIGFQDKPVSGLVRLGIVYDPGQDGSTREARQVAALLHGELPIGGIALIPVLIAQDKLTLAGHLDAIYATAGLDPALLRPALVRLRAPCLTMDVHMLGTGGCMVSVQDDPSVSIVLDQANALAANVHFATAFRMMVKEQ